LPHSRTACLPVTTSGVPRLLPVSASTHPLRTSCSRFPTTETSAPRSGAPPLSRRQPTQRTQKLFPKRFRLAGRGVWLEPGPADQHLLLSPTVSDCLLWPKGEVRHHAEIIKTRQGRIRLGKSARSETQVVVRTCLVSAVHRPVECTGLYRERREPKKPDYDLGFAASANSRLRSIPLDIQCAPRPFAPRTSSYVANPRSERPPTFYRPINLRRRSLICAPVDDGLVFVECCWFCPCFRA
jgi:hypothetical protein